MKKIIIFSLFSVFLFSSNISLSASYPVSCPKAAQGILDAIGCSTIDCKTYSAICEKCCIQAKVPVVVPIQQPVVELPLATPSEEIPTPSIDSSSAKVEIITPSSEKAIEPTPAPQAKKEPQNILVRFFNWLFRRNK